MKADLTLFFVAVFLGALLVGWEWPNIAKIMPVYVAAIPGLVLALVQLFRDATQSDTRVTGEAGGVDMDEVYDVKLDETTERWRTVTFFAWFVGGALGIWLLGITVSLPLLVFLYALVEGREKWTTSVMMAGCAYLLIWGLFEYLLDTRWPLGILLSR